jgi:hypothetical protein
MRREASFIDGFSPRSWSCHFALHTSEPYCPCPWCRTSIWRLAADCTSWSGSTVVRSSETPLSDITLFETERGRVLLDLVTWNACSSYQIDLGLRHGHGKCACRGGRRYENKLREMHLGMCGSILTIALSCEGCKDCSGSLITSCCCESVTT